MAGPAGRNSERDGLDLLQRRIRCCCGTSCSCRGCTSWIRSLSSACERRGSCRARPASRGRADSATRPDGVSGKHHRTASVLEEGRTWRTFRSLGGASGYSSGGLTRVRSWASPGRTRRSPSCARPVGHSSRHRSCATTSSSGRSGRRRMSFWNRRAARRRSCSRQVRVSRPSAVPLPLATALHGIELHEESAVEALSLLRSKGHDASIDVGDFFDVDPEPRYDAVIGNPPYVRYQDFTGEPRTRGRAAALRPVCRSPVSRRPGRRSPSTPRCSSSRRDGSAWSAGRAADGELRRRGPPLPDGTVRARPARAVHERVFPGVLEEVVLLLADGVGPTDHCELYQVRELADLRTLRRRRPSLAARAAGRQMDAQPAFAASALEAYAEMAEQESFTTLSPGVTRRSGWSPGTTSTSR